MNDKVKIAIAIAVTCLLAFGAALVFSQEVTVFIDGVEYDVPEKHKLVIIPDHWDVTKLYRESFRVREITALLPHVMTICNGEDMLVISPASCPAE